MTEARSAEHRRLAEIKLQLAGSPSSRQIAHDQTIAEFENFLGQASGALAGGDAKAARDLAAQANLRICTRGRSLLAETEMTEMAYVSQVNDRKAAPRSTRPS